MRCTSKNIRTGDLFVVKDSIYGAVAGDVWEAVADRGFWRTWPMWEMRRTSDGHLQNCCPLNEPFERAG